MILVGLLFVVMVVGVWRIMSALGHQDRMVERMINSTCRLEDLEGGSDTAILVERLTEVQPRDLRLLPAMAEWQGLGWDFLGIFQTTIGIRRISTIVYLSPDRMFAGFVERATDGPRFEAVAQAKDGTWAVVTGCASSLTLPSTWRSAVATTASADAVAVRIRSFVGDMVLSPFTSGDFAKRYESAVIAMRQQGGRTTKSCSDPADDLRPQHVVGSNRGL